MLTVSTQQQETVFKHNGVTFGIPFLPLACPMPSELMASPSGALRRWPPPRVALKGLPPTKGSQQLSGEAGFLCFLFCLALHLESSEGYA